MKLNSMVVAMQWGVRNGQWQAFLKVGVVAQPRAAGAHILYEHPAGAGLGTGLQLGATVRVLGVIALLWMGGQWVFGHQVGEAQVGVGS